ncbi:hypothetical protein RS3R1_21090 [Pseudomonas atacamensis]|uniref:Uncharacterized protein n=1 Tax=Pseudomonas atacamensis TaxID=2565368 RepID=A0ABQ5PHL8_9PSED|nr:hypothetical protein RS3R1_21090 [Pseudomonas atacamensis]
MCNAQVAWRASTFPSSFGGCAYRGGGMALEEGEIVRGDTSQELRAGQGGEMQALVCNR